MTFPVSQRNNRFPLGVAPSMDDMRVLIVIVAIFAGIAFDIAFNNAAALSWIGAQLGLN
ncbi:MULTISPECIES: hypothetical protein [unclassified Hyphomicrobium]|uniref:hypothetical protein n=1 Tax=unclassified Hyphomicrobium TaxID=2619925 RepID=UPI0012DD8BEA|nr:MULTISPECIES: hypothetical protein [unclassified Hyphomicrobium]